MDFKTMKIKQWFVSSLILYTFKLKYVSKKHLKCKFKSKSLTFFFFSSIIVSFFLPAVPSFIHSFFTFCPANSPFFFDKFAIAAFLFIQFHTAGYNTQVWKKVFVFNFALQFYIRKMKSSIKTKLMNKCWYFRVLDENIYNFNAALCSTQAFSSDLCSMSGS